MESFKTLTTSDLVDIIHNLNKIIAIKEDEFDELDSAACEALEKVEDMTFTQELMSLKIEDLEEQVKSLKKELAKGKKAVAAPVQKKVGRPKKVVVTAKRKPGRPKKVVK